MPENIINDSEASMKDVAGLAGVSTATVSHVINGSRNVRPETRSKVEKAIQTLSYHVNPTARKLRNGRSSIVGFVVSNLTNYFYIEIGSAIEALISPAGYQLFYMNSEESAEKEASHISNCVLENFAGLIIVPVEQDWKKLEKLIGNTPCVFLDRCPAGARKDVVLSTNSQGAFSGAMELIKRGARHIAFLAPSLDPTMQERIEGYEDALHQNGLEVDHECVLFGDTRPKTFSDMLKARDWDKLLEFVIKEKHVDAIFSGNSIFAFSALNYLHRNNIRIPEDLLFATFDAAFWMYSVNSPVIAVEQDKTKLGTVAAELLIRRMSGEVFPLAEKRIDTSLILLNDA